MNFKLSNGESLLVTACSKPKQDAELLKLILQSPTVEVDQKSKEGKTALEVLFDQVDMNGECARLLIEKVCLC